MTWALTKTLDVGLLSKKQHCTEWLQDPDDLVNQ